MLPGDIGYHVDKFLSINDMLDINPEINIYDVIEERNMPKQSLSVKLGNNRLECILEAGEVITEINYYNGKELNVSSNEGDYPIETSYYIMKIWQNRTFVSGYEDYSIMGLYIDRFNSIVRDRFKIAGLPSTMIGFPSYSLDANVMMEASQNLNEPFFKSIFDSTQDGILYPPDLTLYCGSEMLNNDLIVYADSLEVNEIYRVLYWLATTHKIWHPATRFMIPYHEIKTEYEAEIVNLDWP